MSTKLNANLMISMAFAIVMLIGIGVLLLAELLSFLAMLAIGTVVLFAGVSTIVFFFNRSDKHFIASYIKVVGWNLAVFCACLLVLELIFGEWIFERPMNRLNLVRNQTVEYDVSALYEAERPIVTYTRDKWGFRGDYPSVSQIDILTIGGSTTDQRAVNDDETWQMVLQSEFQRNGRDVYVVNAGVDGQTTFGHLKNFEWWFPHVRGLKVRYFLFYVGINDFHKTGQNGYYDDFHRTYGRLRSGKWWKVHDYATSRSALCRLYRTVDGLMTAHRQKVTHGGLPYRPEEWTEKAAMSDYTFMLPGLEAYESRLLRLCQKAREFGGEVIFVTQSRRRIYDVKDGRVIGMPAKGGGGNGVDYYHMSRMLNASTLKVCKEQGGVGVNLDEEVEWDLENDFYDYGHNTPSGSKKIGEYLYRKLKDRF